MARLEDGFRFIAAAVCSLSICASAQTAGPKPPRGAAIAPLSAEMKAAMTGTSWKPGCPVPLDDLEAVRVTYFGFDGLMHQGDLVVHKRFAAETAQIFDELYAVRFPIRKVAPYEEYGPDVYAEQDITVGFYCRPAQDAPNEWSGHAYGLAVDINPLENPFLDAKEGWWPKSAAISSRRDAGRGKLSPGSEAFRIFSRHGWAWGGFYMGEPDYMHFYKLTYGGSGNVLERPYVATGLQYIPGGAAEAAQPK